MVQATLQTELNVNIIIMCDSKSVFLFIWITQHDHNMSLEQVWAQDPGHWINISYLLKKCTVCGLKSMTLKVIDDFASNRSAYMSWCIPLVILLFLFCFCASFSFLFLLKVSPLHFSLFVQLIDLPSLYRKIYLQNWHHKTVWTFSVLSLIWRDRPMSMICGITKCFFPL